MKNNIFLILIFVSTFISIIVLFLKTKSIKDIIKISNLGVLSVESREKDLSLIDVYLNHSFLKVLQEYLAKDLEFSEESPVKKFISGRYCDLIQYLLRPDITFNFKFDDGTEIKRSFFESFIEKVYLLFTAETPENIKNLILKYYSGYTIDTYFLKKKPKPSILPFITESVRNKLWLRYTENETNTQYMLRITRSRNNGSDTDINYQTIMSNYDAECVQKICLDIYNSYEPEIKSMVNPNKSQNTSVKHQNQQQSNGFEVDFSVKPGEGEQK